MNKLVINGNVFETNGKNISVKNGVVTVDGKVIQSGITNVNVTIHGDVKEIDCSGSVTVEGNVTGNVNCGGSAKVSGDVKGDINCGGSCSCGNVGGDIDAGGSVKYKR